MNSQIGLSVTQNELEQILNKFSRNIETEDDEEKLVFYVWEELYKKNGFEPETDQILIRMRELFGGHVTRSLVSKGVLEPMFDPDGDDDTFELTELGKRIGEKLDE